MNNNAKLRIDFFGGTHGKFLEYVINVFLYRRDRGDSELFTDLGTAHATDAKYQADCVVLAYPYSFWNKNAQYAQPCESDHWMRIVVEDFSDDVFFIIMTNGVTRVEDRGFEAYCTGIPDSIRQTRHKFRNWWYSKIRDRRSYPDMRALYWREDFIAVSQPTFEFRYESLLEWSAFCQELTRLAQFLGLDFAPNAELQTLWHTFMARNQGVASKKHCDAILQALASGQDHAVSCSVLEEAWLNYCVAKSHGISSGPLFDRDQYPQSVQEIRDILHGSSIG